MNVRESFRQQLEKRLEASQRQNMQLAHDERKRRAEPLQFSFQPVHLRAHNREVGSTRTILDGNHFHGGAYNQSMTDLTRDLPDLLAGSHPHKYQGTFNVCMKSEQRVGIECSPNKFKSLQHMPYGSGYFRSITTCACPYRSQIRHSTARLSHFGGRNLKQLELQETDNSNQENSWMDNLH